MSKAAFQPGSTTVQYRKEVLINFTGQMVRAIRAGNKSQTRRLVKFAVSNAHVDHFAELGLEHSGKWRCYDSLGEPMIDTPVRCPYGTPGQVLRMKESAWVWCRKVRNGITGTGRAKWRYEPVGRHVIYQADHPSRPAELIDDNPDHGWRLKVARFLPGWAVRMRLEVTDVRIERLLDITEEDARAEGVEKSQDKIFPYTYAYATLWETINGRGTWKENPWVWVVSFRIVSP